MSSSYIGFARHGFWASDPSLEPWAAALSTAVAATEEPPAWLVTAGEEWRLLASGIRGEAAPFALDAVVADDAERAGVLVALAERARSELDLQIRLLGADVVAGLYGVDRIESVLAVAGAFHDLLLSGVAGLTPPASAVPETPRP